MPRGSRSSTAAAAAEAGAVAQTTGLAQIARPGLEETQQSLLEVAECCVSTEYSVQQLEQKLLRWQANSTASPKAVDLPPRLASAYAAGYVTAAGAADGARDYWLAGMGQY
jgi:hypothetical protein